MLWTRAGGLLAAMFFCYTAAVVVSPALAQPGTPAASSAPAAPIDKGPLPIAVQGEQILVKREAASLIDPDKYRVNLSLQPYHVVVVAAPFDAVVKQIPEKINTRVKPQTEVLRLENTVQKLVLQRVQAEYKLATLEQKKAEGEDQKAVATAKLEASKAQLDLAQHQFDQTSIRTPIGGEIRRIWVVEGQFVRAGDPLVEIGDSSRVKVEVPLERKQANKGAAIPLKVEAAEVQGTIDAVLPLATGFDPLRDLFESITSAIVVLDNPDGKYFAGQTVYVPLVPRNPVAQLASSAVLNNSDGTRRVQVLRNAVVRDLPVSLMGPVGVDRLYVSGPFAPNDEIIYQTSHQLPDGFQLQPWTGTAGNTAGGATPAGARPPAATKTGTGF